MTMRKLGFALLTAQVVLAHAASAQSGPAKPDTTRGVADPSSAKPAFTTGVAKGRDLLDSAISASTISSSDLAKIGTTSIGEIVGNIPGIRAETAGTDGMVGITVRGLPLASDGAKYLQIEEDGLPVLEFGDIQYATPTAFLRADLSVSQVQAIRGGSASTFASNSPGGVVNFVSRTGEGTGGVVQFSSGLNYGLGRVDFDYGEKIDDRWRFNIGGFYRQGEGPRAIGYDAFKGGQLKFNLTRTFAAGYIRFYAKVMDDREPSYSDVPVVVSGTNASPHYAPLPGLDTRNSTVGFRYNTSTLALDQNNSPQSIDLHQGNRSKVRSFGIEGEFDIAGWTVTDRFRYAQNSGTHNETQTLGLFPAATVASLYGGAGATLSYADGPSAAQIVADPVGINGNGLAGANLLVHADLQSLDNVTNDVRINRVFKVGSGKLTTSAGLYASSQDIDMVWSFSTVLTDFAGGGNSTLLDVTTAAGVPITQQGTLGYSTVANNAAQTLFQHRDYQTHYRVLAPYGSVNYQLGKLSLGASARYDLGKASGTTYGWELFGDALSLASVDFNRNGVVTLPETLTASLPLSRPGLVSYNYKYLSYSAGANYRLTEDVSTFAHIAGAAVPEPIACRFHRRSTPQAVNRAIPPTPFVTSSKPKPA